MKKDRIHIYEMESYKHASEEQRNSMRICKIRYFDLEGLPSKEVKEILEAFIWERGKTLALSSLATELTTYNNILLMPEAVEALKQMILVAWAGGESVMDLRCLLDGRKVPLVKSADKWVVSLSQLPLLLTDGGSVRGNDSGEGVGYSDYIRMFLFLKSVPEITMRTLDCVEEALHSKHILFQADQCVTKLEIQNKITVYKNLNYQYPVYFGYE